MAFHSEKRSAMTSGTFFLILQIKDPKLLPCRLEVWVRCFLSCPPHVSLYSFEQTTDQLQNVRIEAICNVVRDWKKALLAIMITHMITSSHRSAVCV